VVGHESEARRRIANDKAATPIRQVQKIVKEDDYMELDVPNRRGKNCGA
jgi:hypothetical protein